MVEWGAKLGVPTPYCRCPGVALVSRGTLTRVTIRVMARPRVVLGLGLGLIGVRVRVGVRDSLRVTTPLGLALGLY